MTTRDIIREEYIKLRRKTQPFYGNRENKRLEQALDKAVKIVEQIGADPSIYVIAQYKYKANPDFYETYLYSQYAAGNYTKYLEQYTSTTLKQEFDAQWNMLSNFMRTKRPLDAILLDPDSNLSAWFRVSATKDIIPSVMAVYGDKAKIELKNKELCAFLQSMKVNIERIKNYGKC